MSAAMSPSALFDLTEFEHAELFAGCQWAWEALPRLAAYIEEHARAEVDPSAVVEPGAHVEGAVRVGPGARIERGAFVRGPAILGPGTEVRFGAYLRGRVLTGRGCVLGNSSEFKTTILLDRAQAAHYAYCGDSILGARVNLGAGTKLSNLRIDGRDVCVRFEGQKLDTGLRKLGAILGDDTQTGCNAVLNPGTVTGRGVHVWPLAVANGWHAPGSVVRAPRREAR